MDTGILSLVHGLPVNLAWGPRSPRGLFAKHTDEPTTRAAWRLHLRSVNSRIGAWSPSRWRSANGLC